MKTITKIAKFKRADGSRYQVKVKFYGDTEGIYTITDKNGEHEHGLWIRQQLKINRNGILVESRDKSAYSLTYKTFNGSEYQGSWFTYQDIANYISTWETTDGQVK